LPVVGDTRWRIATPSADAVTAGATSAWCDRRFRVWELVCRIRTTMRRTLP
jgi:hypothetical protein